MEKRRIRTYPNQKIVTVKKAAADKKHIYAILNKERLFIAMKGLSPNELKTYLYLASNQNDYTFAMSPVEIAESTGSDKRSIQNAINGLIKKGYLCQEKGNKYNFCE